jgi:Tfp pilus assembly protein FimT
MAKHHPISARTHGSSQQGLSLLDLVAGIAVAFVLCFLAFPSQHQLLSRYRTLAHAQELTQLLLYARGEAIRRGSRILVTVQWSTPFAAEASEQNASFGFRTRL